METSSKCLQPMHSLGSNLPNASNVLQNNLLNRSADSLIHCPTCDSQLRRSEVAEHCEQEMERLRQMKTQPLLESTQDVESEEERTSFHGGDIERKKPWTVFQRVQRNRQSRMKSRTRKRPAVIEHACPVCNLGFPKNEIQAHVDICLRRNNGSVNGRRSSDEHSSNDDDDVAEEYEEYEWAGQKRIRVSSLLQGGYASLGIGQAITNGVTDGCHRNNNEEDEDLNVDEDDTQIYGPAQYGESDIITPMASFNNDCRDVTSYMRHLITSSTTNPTNDASDVNIHNESQDLTSSTNCHSGAEVSENVTIDCKMVATTPAQYQQIIESLKSKLRHYENHVPGKYKCLICLDDYRNPAISVACWHVHCESCWLRSLGARKLCPQCNLITTPRDLRRIYM